MTHLPFFTSVQLHVEIKKTLVISARNKKGEDKYINVENRYNRLAFINKSLLTTIYIILYDLNISGGDHFNVSFIICLGTLLLYS